MANTKQDFYDWVKVAYPGYWAEDMSSIDWTLPYYASMIQKWIALGYPSGKEAVAPTTGGEAFVETPSLMDTSKLKIVIPDSIWYDPTTSKYWYKQGAGLVEVSAAEAMYLREEYDKGYEQMPTAPVDWQEGAEAARLAEEQRQFDITQAWKGKQAPPTAPPEHGGGAIAEVVSESGYDYQIYRDANGVVRDKVMIGRTEAPPERWQEGAEVARLALEKEKFTWQREQAGKAQDPELQRATNELRWERDRIQLLSGLPSDDWVSAYTLQNQPNPYKVREEDVLANRMNQVATNLDTRTGEVQALQGQLAQAVTTGDTVSAAKLEAELKNTTASRDYLYNLYNTMQKEQENWTPQPVPQPYPNAPRWLPKYAPGQTTGRMITAQNVPTPSGQQLTGMSPSQAGQLGYFADWTKKMGGGRNWKDILSEAEIMQPRTPAGAGRSRWTPQRF